MRVLIAHNPVAPGDDPSTADVLDEAVFVEQGLAALGILSERRAVAGPEALAGLAAPDTVIFNLIESPPGEWWRQCAAAGTLELLGLSFTGAPAAALWLTTDKLLTRAVLAAEGLPVAPGGWLDPEDPFVLDRAAPPWILKPACEDASIGLDGRPVCATRDEALARAALLHQRFPDQRIVAEHFLPGRELNVSVLEGPDGPEILPIPEMTYVDYPEDLPKIMGWDAKWGEGTFAYDHTVRRFLTDPADEPLLARVREIVRHAWKVCGLAGYARVDLRLDEAGRPCILEVNANPCIAEGAGLEVSAARAGIGPAALIRRILDSALLRHARCTSATVPVPAAPSRKHPDRPVIEIRRNLKSRDRKPLEELIGATGFFNPEEIAIALELADDRIEQGEASHYRFSVSEIDSRLAGYACWGTIDGTKQSVDLYWIAVHPGFQGRGIGAALLDDAEAWITASGRTRVYVETSTRAQYESTRAFYRARGYTLSAELADFYAPGDGKAMFVKVLELPESVDSS